MELLPGSNHRTPRAFGRCRTTHTGTELWVGPAGRRTASAGPWPACTGEAGARLLLPKSSRQPLLNGPGWCGGIFRCYARNCYREADRLSAWNRIR